MIYKPLILLSFVITATYNKEICIASNVMCTDSNINPSFRTEEIYIFEFKWNVTNTLSPQYAFDSFIVVAVVSSKPLNFYSLLFMCISLNSNISLFVKNSYYYLTDVTRKWTRRLMKSIPSHQTYYIIFQRAV